MKDRRDFLKHTLVAGAASKALYAQSTSGVKGANDRIRIGLIGCGTMGRGNLNLFLRAKNVECTALCDVDDTHTEMAIGVVTQTGAPKPGLLVRDFRRLLDDKDIDAIVVATPDHWHALPTVMGCQAGKDVYVQKPMAASIGEGRAMVAAARKYNRIIQVGTQQRSSGQFMACVDFVRSGQLGKIRQVRCWAYLDSQLELPPVPDSEPASTVDYDMWLGPAPKRPFNKNRFHHDFRWYWDYSGGTMMDWGAHMLDIALWGMRVKAPLSVVTAGGKLGFPGDARETPDTQQVLYEYDGFTMIWEHAQGLGHGPGSTHPSEHGIAFYGHNAVAVVDRWGWQVFGETEFHQGKGRQFRTSGMPRVEQPLAAGAHEQNFIDCMRTRKPPHSDAEVGYDTLVLCHLGNIAHRSGRKIYWDSAQEAISNDPESQKLVDRAYREPWKLTV